MITYWYHLESNSVVEADEDKLSKVDIDNIALVCDQITKEEYERIIKEMQT